MADLRAHGRRFAVATVVRTVGSTPQVAGAKLVLDETDRCGGTLGGGCVEADAMIAARDVLAKGGHSLRAYELTEDLAWNTGLVCGGTMWILAERGDDSLSAGGRDLLDELLAAASGATAPMAVITMLRREGRNWGAAGRAFLDAAGALVGTFGDEATDRRIAELALRQSRHGTSRLVAVDDDREVLIEAVASKPRLVIAGGGHVARAIARQALLVDFDVTVLEDRPEFSDPARFDGATVLPGNVPETLGRLDYGYNTFIVIATRGHKLDADCVLAAARTQARYIGLLGSRRKTVLVEEMLRREGIADGRLAAIHAPVGLDLGGRTPAEIALSVLAEITRERYEASGAPLRFQALKGSRIL